MRASRGWSIGWALGAVVVALAAGLLLTIVGLARRIAGQAREIEQAIDGARANTAPLFDLARLNLALDRSARALAARREQS